VKVITILLSLYIGFLTCVPCVDADACADEQDASEQLIISSHDHIQPEADMCSPFCICNCCNPHVTQPGYFVYDAFNPVFEDNNSILKTHSEKSVSHAIWQPPRSV
jgi:hypothetical protein